jgi:hypothetical protein
MKLKEKISLEEVFEKEYKTKYIEPENNKEAIITHFLHNKNGGSKFFKKDAIKFTKEILEYKYPNEEVTFLDIKKKEYLGVTLKGRAFRINLFARSSQKGFPLQSLTQKVA